jgi:hypothetical protein
MSPRIGRTDWWVIPAVVIAVLAMAWPPARGPVALLLFCLAPGWTATRWLREANLLVRTILAVTISLAVTTIVSLGLFYLDVWSWQACIAAVAGLTVVMAVFAPPERSAP